MCFSARSSVTTPVSYTHLRGSNIFIAVAGSRRADVHNDRLRIDAELGHNGVELLGKVDVNSRLRADLLVVRKPCGRADGLVVFVTRGEHEDALACKRFSALVEQLRVLFHVLAAHDDCLLYTSI